MLSATRIAQSMRTVSKALPMTRYVPGAVFAALILLVPLDHALSSSLQTANGLARLVKDIRTTPSSADCSVPNTFAAGGNTVYFIADDGVHHRNLWRSDGSAAGTAMVGDLFGVCDIKVVNGVVFFSGYSDSGIELWRSDGTADGTTLMIDISVGPTGSDPFPFAQIGGITLFSATDPTNGRELWRTDGTEAGTLLVRDIQMGVSSSNPANALRLDGTVVFEANDGVSGRELWRSDGTRGGTMLLDDLLPS
ncbi:MAG: hypothetical protein M1358_08500 [Chloroflexi bacterium]|nr:hypothetical protein [Chloroflexota bacterium]